MAMLVIVALLGIFIYLGWLLDYNWDIVDLIVRAITRKFIVRDFFPTLNPLRWTGWAYLLFVTPVLAFSISLARWKYVTQDRPKNSYSKGAAAVRVRRISTSARVVVELLAMAMVMSLGYGATGFWNNDKAEANSYLWATTFVVEDENKLPTSVVDLAKAAEPSSGECLYKTAHDVHSCIQRGTLPDNWDSRAASKTAAEIVMARTSGSTANTDVMDETLTYLYTPGGGGWSAIRNGRGQQPLDGVVMWDGSSSSAQSCRFAGQYSINFAFGGDWGQNLDNMLADKYPGLFYELGDIWGFCRGDGDVSSKEPVIVIPVTEQQAYGRRTTLRSAGVLVIKGSPSGEPVIEHWSSVKPGDLPGPSYPASLVTKQRDMLQWSAGRAVKKRNMFGYEPTNVASQAGNDAEYLLRDRDSGRLYWVTPLTPRGSKSQALVAYSITSADESSAGDLNEQRVYVLPDNDPRIANVDSMSTSATNAIKVIDPSFFTGNPAGKLTEFLPINAKTWQVFAEFNGRVRYRIEVPVDGRTSPIVENIEPGQTATPSTSTPTTPATPTTAVSCGSPTDQLSDQALGECIQHLTQELVRRHQ